MDLRGSALLNERYLNKGTAFSDEERAAYRLHGLLPPVVETLDIQLERVAVEYAGKQTEMDRHVFLRALQERNSVLFYSFLSSNIEALLPIVYTPTVGLACQQFSRIYRREHGLYLSWPLRDQIPEMLENAIGDKDIDIVVVTDGERILGLGDLGIGGMGIPIGKLALYTVAGGLDPARTLPVLLDAGTDNGALLSDPLYMGWRNHRVRDDTYDELVDAFIDALCERLPNVMLQWEDFAQTNANRLLTRHRERICSFNDDIQGTAAVAGAAIASGMHVAGEDMAELRVVIVGAGSAGTGIAQQVARMLMAEGLDEHEARSRCWLIDRDGLLHDGLFGAGNEAFDFQEPFIRRWTDIESWDENNDGVVDLLEVVRNVAPHALVGVTGQPGLFTEAVIRAQAEQVRRPIVLPLSNPTPRAEAIPSDVLDWTDDRALIGTGSPFDPVPRMDGDHLISQVNNVYVFPGIGLGVVASGATRVSDGMLTAATRAIGEFPREPGDTGLLPPLVQTGEVARHVARAVAGVAVAEGLAEKLSDDEIAARVEASCWQPSYRPLD